MLSLCLPWVFLCLVVNTQAVKPRPTPCKPPPLFEGQFVATIGNDTTFLENISMMTAGRNFTRLSFPNKTVASDQLTLFKEKVMYDISYEHKTCERKPINLPFPPMAIPPAAVFEKQFVLGSLSEPGKGLLLNVWSGTDPQVTGHYEVTSTEDGCLPIGTKYYKWPEWHTTVFHDVVYGIKDPNVFIPSSFCKTSQAENSNEVDG